MTDDLRHRYAEALQKATWSWGDGSLHQGLADAVLAVRDQEMTRLRRDLETAQAAIVRVRKLHKRVAMDTGSRTEYCDECCDGVVYPWPCPTIDALDNPQGAPHA